ncbi:hypothetical protein BV22DRAFT_415840 [Leucogyrophana mollusca]|uniref:Uncharacterized protein n=1 Tax=Leucogyrophana mollusca TaxID=85980 RepID=A0ACB8BK03_9AGAM|nr:hypothetical protein BV22DRAFT_415840 [Leucogyrophana mollusca]
MMQCPSTPAHLPNFRLQHMYQDHMGPSLSLSDSGTDFLEGSSTYGGYNLQPCSAQGGEPSPSALCGAFSRQSISIDIPPSLAGFRTIADPRISCDWSDALSLLCAQPLSPSYTHPSLDKSAIGHQSVSSYVCDLPKSSPMVTAPNPSPPFTSAGALPGPSSAKASSGLTQSIRTACASTPRSIASHTAKAEGPVSRPREKKHGCWMCEKSFDRPSTLKKVSITLIIINYGSYNISALSAPPCPYRRERYAPSTLALLPSLDMIIDGQLSCVRPAADVLESHQT